MAGPHLQPPDPCSRQVYLTCEVPSPPAIPHSGRWKSSPRPLCVALAYACGPMSMLTTPGTLALGLWLLPCPSLLPSGRPSPACTAEVKVLPAPS